MYPTEFCLTTGPFLIKGACDHRDLQLCPKLFTGTDSPIGLSSYPTDTGFYHAFYPRFYFPAPKEY